MKKAILILALCAIAGTASAQIETIGGGGLSLADANSRYCQLTGCTMVGALTASSSGIIFNGTTVKAGGANILNIGNGTNAQALRIYNTDDGAGNAEYGTIDWTTSASNLTIATVKTGTGTQRQIQINGNNITFLVGGSSRWQINNTTLSPTTVNTLDIAATGTPVKTAYIATSIQSGAVKTLAETSATGFVTVAIPNSGGCAGYVDYTIFAADATNTQLVSGQLFFSAAATSGGTVTAAAVSDQHTLNPVTSGTLTNTMTSTTGANLLTLLANATSSLTQTTLEVRYRVMLQGGTCTVTGL